MLRDPWLHSPVTAAQAAAAKTQVGNIHNVLTGLRNMTPDDKLHSLKVGLPQIAMINQIRTICEQNPTVMPSYHDLPTYYATVDSVQNLTEVHTAMQKVMEAVSATLMGAKDDAMRLSLDYYYALKRAQASAIPGLRPLYMAVRDNFIHDVGVSPEDQFPEDDPGKNNTNTNTDDGSGDIVPA